MKLLARIRRSVAAHAGEMSSLLSGLVQRPSVTGREEEAQLFLADFLRSRDFSPVLVRPCDIPELERHPAYGMVSPRAASSPNVVCVWRGEGTGRSMALNGHVDVVEAGDERQWSFPPWSGQEKEGRIYGRGACDMKGGLVSAIWAMLALRGAGIRLKGDVVFQSVVGEEDGGSARSRWSCSAPGWTPPSSPSPPS